MPLVLLAAEGLGNNAEVSLRDFLENIEASLQNKSSIKLKIKDLYISPEEQSLLVTVQSGKMTLAVLNRENLKHRVCGMDIEWPS